jgi:hypothetical protein
VAKAQGAGFVRPFFQTHSETLGNTPFEAIKAGQTSANRLRAAVRHFPVVVERLGIEPKPLKPWLLEPTGSKSADRLSAAGFEAADLAIICGAGAYTGPSALMRFISESPEAEAKLRLAARVVEDLNRMYARETVRVLLMWNLTKLNLDGSIAHFIAEKPPNATRQLRRVTDVLLFREVKLHSLV